MPGVRGAHLVPLDKGSDLSRRADQGRAPTHIDRYRVRRTLGGGAQGVVYLAHDPKLERDVAVKTLRSRVSLRGKGESLLEEARTAARLNHPNIVRVFDVGSVDAAPFVVYEFVPGVSLREVLAGSERLDTGRVVGIVGQILDALDYAHRRGVVHRDIKPANILLDEAGVARLADFGIAGLLGEPADGGLRGTAGYMPPEQIDRLPLQRELDLFAVGAVFYEMLAGGLPIEELNPYAMLHRLATEDIEPPSARRPGVDPALDPIVMKALAPDPAQRFADAAEFRQALQGYLEHGAEAADGPLPPGGSGTLEFLLRKMRRRPDFPAMSQHVNRINRMAVDGGDWSASALANVVLRDYSLTAKLLRLVNSPLFAAPGREITTVSRAIVILGFKQVRLAALSLLLFEHLQRGEAAAELRDSAVSALVSGLMAHRLAARVDLEEPEEAFVCAMFHQLGRHLAIYYFPEEYRAIEDLVSRKGLDVEAAAGEILGVSLHELACGVARYWSFPETLVQSMGPLPRGRLPRAAGRGQSLHQVAAMSNELCALAGKLRPEQAERAVAELCERFAGTLPLDGAEAVQALGAAVEGVAQYGDILHRGSGPSTLLRQLGEWKAAAQADEDEGEAEAPPGQPEPEDAASEPPDAQSLLLAGVQDVTNALLEDWPLNQVLTMVLEIVYRSLHPDRVLFWVLDPKRREVSARFGFGRDVDTLLNRLRFAVGSGDLFDTALGERRDLLAGDVLAAGAEPLPEWYRALVQTRTLIVYPLQLKTTVLGLVTVEWDEPERLPPDAALNLLQTLRNQALLAVRQRGTR